MAFFTFTQNNSGGSWNGPHDVIVEASTAEEANRQAEAVGVYFGGVLLGRDCECCGDRWCGAYGEGDSVPSIYGEPVTEAGDEVVVYFADGRVEKFSR